MGAIVLAHRDFAEIVTREVKELNRKLRGLRRLVGNDMRFMDVKSCQCELGEGEFAEGANVLKSRRIRYKNGCAFRSKVVVALCVLGPSAKLLPNRVCACICASIMGSTGIYAGEAGSSMGSEVARRNF